MSAILLGVPSADYHARPEVSKSQLDTIAKSPAHFFAEHVARTVVRHETDAMRLGTALHTAVLEPERYVTDYVVAPKIDGRTKEGKAAKAAFAEASAGKIIIDDDDHVRVLAMAASIAEHRAATLLFERSPLREVSYVWRDAATGIDCRCRPDAVLDGGRVLVDLKSCEDASPRGFAQSIGRYGYHRQAAFYLDGVEAATGTRPEAFVFVAVEKAAPHVVGVYALDAHSIQLGKNSIERSLETLATCRASGKWPGYTEIIETISAPAWAS